MAPILRDDELAADPLAQLRTWIAEADPEGEVGEVTATLATVDGRGHPDARVVVVRAVSADGLTFFSDTRSRKGEHLAQVPHAALVIHWPAGGRQVRLRGRVEMLPDDANDAAYLARPLRSRIGYWANHQSATVADRETLVAQAEATARRFTDQELPRPQHWVVYRLLPDVVEFWQAADDHLHDRFEYTRSGEGWRRARLQP